LGVYRILISLQLAVVLLLLLTLSLIIATTLESRWDTPTAQFYVYRAPWFAFLLLMLGVNILAVALSRFPWKRRHIPFLSAHLGILLLLLGSWVTRQHGVDGLMRVQEAEKQSVAEIDEPQLILRSPQQTRIVPIPWRPPHTGFQPMALPYGLSVEEYLSRAEPVYSFEPSTTEQARPAVQLKFTTKRAMGGMPAMAASHELWLWEGAEEWQSSDAGPARVMLGGARPQSPGPWIWLRAFPAKPGSKSREMIEFEAVSWRQEKTQGKVLLPARGALSGVMLDPGWKAVQIELKNWVPAAFPRTDYQPAKVLYGPKAPPSAIRIRGPRLPDGRMGDLLWLGSGDRATFELGGETIQISYGPKRVLLPFALELQRFQLERYPGSSQPASFSSLVRVEGDGSSQKVHHISMNEPLEWKGFTFYQSSYEDAEPRPTVSIFSVNRDPGRALKYWGSLILVVGIVHFYVARARTRRSGLVQGSSQSVGSSEGSA
jgi:energy-coupling factor transporter transmembrane protein EcfT